jgi:branched-chain amino acid transport system ATP-binding protein
MLRIHSIHAHYGDVHVLKNLSLEVGEAEIISLVGSNGAGKTTALQVLSGLLRPTSGEVHFLGERIDHLPPHRIVERGLVQVPEGRQLSSLTVLEEMGLPGLRLHKSRENLEKLAFFHPAREESRLPAPLAAGAANAGDLRG